MVFGIGALASLGLALPTGMAFGYGYGYGVRAGYHSYKPSKNDEITKLRLSPNPIQAGTGMGLASAEERTGGMALPQLPLSDDLSSKVESDKLEQMGQPERTVMVNGKRRLNPDLYYQNKYGRVIMKSQIRTHEDYVSFMKHNRLPNTHLSKSRRG